MTRCPGIGQPPGPSPMWRAGFGGLHVANGRATCPVCGKRVAKRADGLVRSHEPATSAPANSAPLRRTVTQK